MVSAMLCQLLLCFLAFSSVSNEVPLLNRKAVFPVRMNAEAGRCMHTIYIHRESIYHKGSKRQRVGFSAKVDPDISGWITVSKYLSWYF